MIEIYYLYNTLISILKQSTTVLHSKNSEIHNKPVPSILVSLNRHTIRSNSIATFCSDMWHVPTAQYGPVYPVHPHISTSLSPTKNGVPCAFLYWYSRFAKLSPMRMYLLPWWIMYGNLVGGCRQSSGAHSAIKFHCLNLHKLQQINLPVK